MSDKPKVDIKHFNDWGEEESAYALIGATAALSVLTIIADKGLEQGALLTISKQGTAEKVTPGEAAAVKSTLTMLLTTSNEMVRRHASNTNVTEVFEKTEDLGKKVAGLSEALFDVVADELMPEIISELEKLGVPVKDVLDERKEERQKDGWRKWVN